jgi:hypothetical protein
MIISVILGVKTMVRQPKRGLQQRKESQLVFSCFQKIQEDK